MWHTMRTRDLITTKHRTTMRKLTASLAVGGLALAVCMQVGTDAAHAKKITDRLKVACSGDYDRFCKGYKVESSKLRSCMRANGKRLSTVCVEALVDAGWVSRKVLRNRR